MTNFRGVKDTLNVQVKAKVPQDRGKVLNVGFMAKYKIPDVPTARRLIEDAQEGTTNDDDIMREWCVGWSGLKGENDDDIVFNEENMEEALLIGPYRAALVAGFMEILFGRQTLKRKN